MVTKNDIFSDPELNDASSFYFGIVQRAIDTGEKAALAATQRLSAFSIPQDEYTNYMVRREDVRRGAPKVDFVRVAAGSERYSESLTKLFSDVVGKPLDPESLSKRVTGFYGKGNL